MVEQQQRLLGERREQLVGALRERDEARLEARRASDACERAKRSLARATEMLRRSALEETARIGATSPSTHDAAGEHEQMAAENRVARSELEARVLQLTEDVERLTSRATELEEALNHETNRADFAASQSAALVAEAEVASEDATSARQELADALARDTESLARISELTEQFADLRATAAATLCRARCSIRPRGEAGTAARCDRGRARVGVRSGSAAGGPPRRDCGGTRDRQIAWRIRTHGSSRRPPQRHDPSGMLHPPTRKKLDRQLAATVEEREAAHAPTRRSWNANSPRRRGGTRDRQVPVGGPRTLSERTRHGRTRVARQAASHRPAGRDRSERRNLTFRAGCCIRSVGEAGRQLAATVEEREAARTTRTELERQLAATVEERETAGSRWGTSNAWRAHATRTRHSPRPSRRAHRPADGARGDRRNDGGGAGSRTRASPSSRSCSRRDDHDPDGEVLTYVDELEAKLGGRGGRGPRSPS